MAQGVSYSLNSTKTAIAIILPASHSSDVNAIRSVHDKAFHKWPPHINILYPSVTIDQLKTALPLFRTALAEELNAAISITADRIGTFSHRHNATIFLQPDEASEILISSIREKLVEAIRVGSRAGTVDGTFRPHLSLGQATLSGGAVESLVEKCSELTGLRWNVSELAVLTRKPSGEMEIVDSIPLGASPKAEQNSFEVERVPERPGSVWSPCFAFDAVHGWQQYTGPITNSESEGRPISILSYNLLADTFGCSFEPRLPLIIEAIKSASKDHIDEVLCLQEVSSSMIADILSHPYIQQRYPYCSHSTTSLLVNYLNLVTLSTRLFSFTSHHFEERHKSALVVRPTGSHFEVANIHLTAALKDHTVAAKQRQLKSLTNFLTISSQNAGRHPVIAGDFNLATSSVTIQYALRRGDISFATSIAARSLVDPDIWHDAYLLSRDDDEVVGDEDGATFDVQRNILASESNAPADQRPQRYDRILFHKGSSVRVRSFKIFGLPDDTGQCGSDHFGIAAVLDPVHEAPNTAVADAEFITIVLAETGSVFAEALIQPFLPSAQAREQRKTAIAQLNKVLTRDARLADVVLLPLGSYAMDTYFAGSDIDVLVVGTLSPTAFFNIATARLQTTCDKFGGLHYINSLVPVIELEMLGIKFDVQYCQAPEVLSRGASLTQSSLSDLRMDEGSLEGLHPATLRPLNTFRDAQHLIHTIPCVESFRTAHRYLSLFLRRRGLYSAKFGYLGGVHLSLLLNHLIKRIDPGEVNSISAEELIITFIHYFARSSWENEIICDPAYPHTDYRRTPREPVVILAIHSPTARPNVASSCTKLSAATLIKEFALAKKHLANDDWEWMLRGKELAFQDFVQSFGAFIVTTIDMWDLQNFDETTHRALIGHVESRVPVIMVQLGRIDGVYAQAWPYQLLSPDDEVEEGKQCKIRYIFGVSGPAQQDVEGRKLTQTKVVQVARNLETLVRGSEYYEEKHIWVQVEVKSRRHIVDLNLLMKDN
jgi:poly(A) polymerase Pap1/endonuclease/exonuclease/phosphatase family metal-dependent hydrolase